MVERPRTVLGQPIRSSYNVVLAHEHLVLDLRTSLKSAPEASGWPVGIAVDRSSAAVMRGTNPFAYPDNLQLEARHAHEALAEIDSQTLIVDVTPTTLGRQMSELQRLSMMTGIDILTGCGRYLESSWPQSAEPAVEQLMEEILCDFARIPRPSVIGEIGTGSPISRREETSLRAAVRAQCVLSVPLYVHLNPWAREGHAALDLVEAEGGDVARVVLCHLDPSLAQGLSYATSLLKRGCYIAFDLWGNTATYGDQAMPPDELRASATARLTEQGFGNRIVHSHDLCLKTQLPRFGGPGLSHIERSAAGLLASHGLNPDQIRMHLSTNALTLLRGG